MEYVDLVSKTGRWIAAKNKRKYLEFRRSRKIISFEVQGQDDEKIFAHMDYYYLNGEFHEHCSTVWALGVIINTFLNHYKNSRVVMADKFRGEQ